MKSYTPGPWHVEAPYSERPRTIVRHDPTGVRIAEVLDGDHPLLTKAGLTRDAEANARLIAAAPDLLTQLEALVVQIEASGRLIVPPGVTISARILRQRKNDDHCHDGAE